MEPLPNVAIPFGTTIIRFFSIAEAITESQRTVSSLLQVFCELPRDCCDLVAQYCDDGAFGDGGEPKKISSWQARSPDTVFSHFVRHTGYDTADLRARTLLTVKEG